MHMDPAMPGMVLVVLILLLVGVVLRLLHQPHVVGYLLAGVLVGPDALGLVSDGETMTRLGALGVVLLLFFVGMEVSPAKLRGSMRVAVVGTLLQAALSVGVVALLGAWLGWPLGRIVLLGFVISLSSTAVVIKILETRGELDGRIGQDVLAILLAQDLIVIPMLIITGSLGGHALDLGLLARQLLGGLLAGGVMFWIMAGRTVRLPFGDAVGKDHELQVFAALALCFGIALITGLFGLSTALGAFLAGMIVSAAKETHWVHRRLEPFRVVFLALFFVSIGLLVDLDYLREHWVLVGVLTLAVLITNTVLNALILRFLGYGWADGLYAGSMLSQVGEFSFVLAAVGMQAGLISAYGYQLAVAVIGLSLMFSPFWIGLARRVLPRPG
ncbi:MAG: cation:proton antiporter [Chromatiales bacterium]|nr:cation:proton antiporter [Chromatiales bacterium]